MDLNTMETKLNILERAFTSSVGPYYNINLTKDLIPGKMCQIVDGKICSINEMIGLQENARFSDVIRYWSSKMKKENRDTYLQFFSIPHLLNCYKNGETHLVHQYWTKSVTDEDMIAQHHIHMYQDEVTGDVLAVTYLIDLIQNYREERYKNELEESYSELNEEKKLLETLSSDYTSEYICDLDHDLLIPIKQMKGSNAWIVNEDLKEYKFIYSIRIAHYYHKFVIEKTAPDFLEKLNLNNMRTYLREHDRFSYRYKALPNPLGWQYFEVQMVRLKNADGNKAIFGFRYVDDILAEEERQKDALQEVNEQLKSQIAVISGLSNAYFAVYRVNLKKNSCLPIKNIPFFEMAVKSCKSAEEVTNAFLTLCVQKEDQEKMRDFTDRRKIEERLKEQDSAVMEFHGAISPWEWCRASWIVATRNPDGDVEEVLFSVEDVTENVLERKKIEEERRQENVSAQTRLETMAEAIHGGFKLSKNDDVSTLIMVSEQLSSMLGFASPQELINQYPTMMDMIHPEDEKREINQAIESIRAGDMYTMHFRMRCKDGGWKNVEDRGRLIYKSNGEGELWSFITDQDELMKKTEALEKVTRANIALEKAQKELKEAKDIATRANKAKTTFLFNMSHDIRTPMNAIIGYTELLKKHPDDAEKREDYVSKIQDSSDFLLSLINSVLEMARIESGKLKLEETAVQWSEIMDSITTVYDEEMRKKQITFLVKTEMEHPYVYCDVLKVKEILLNLLSNAYKYTYNGGCVMLSVKEYPVLQTDKINLRMIVEDNGIGMSSDYLPTLFEEFTRERGSSGNRIEGTGLGMAIVKRLIDLMNGEINVESKLGKGTRFTVSLDLKIARKEEIKKETSQFIESEKFIGKRILLAEDNDLNAEIAIELIKDYGFLIERAVDGQNCIEMIEKEESGYYDVVLMDVQMPKLNGYEATKKIRNMKEKGKREIPVIAMTANAFEEDRRNAIDAGMDDYLSKPIDIVSLLKKITLVLKKKRLSFNGE